MNFFKNYKTLNPAIFNPAGSLFFVWLFVVPYAFGYYSLPLYLLAILMSGLFVLKDPAIGIYTIIITTMIFERFFSWAPLVILDQEIKIYLLDLVILATLFSWIYHWLKEKRKGMEEKGLREMMISPLTKSIIIFIIILIIGFLRSMINEDLEVGLALATLKNFFYVILYFLVLAIFNTQKKIVNLIKIIIYTGLALIPFVCYGFISGHGLWSDLTPGVRLVAAPHAIYLVLVVILGLALLIKDELNFRWVKITFLSTILVQIIGFLGGMFRHLWLGFLAALLFTFLLLDPPARIKLLKIFAGYLIILFLLISGWYWLVTIINNPPVLSDNFYFQSFLFRSETLFNLREETIEGSAGWRLAVSSQGLIEFLKNPILGQGLGAKIRFSFRGWEQIIEVRSMHNDLVAIILQLGLVGIVLFITILYFNFKNLTQVFKSHNKQLSVVAVSLIGIFVVEIFAVTLSLYFGSNMISLFFWLFLGVSQAMVNVLRKFITPPHLLLG